MIRFQQVYYDQGNFQYNNTGQSLVSLIQQIEDYKNLSKISNNMIPVVDYVDGLVQDCAQHIQC